MSERGVYARRLALAAIASGVVHLLLWGGLTATRLTLLGNKPQDATAAKPALKPKLAADFPLMVPKSPVAKPAHERPLDMQVMPPSPQDAPRPVPDRPTPPPAAPKMEPEQSLPIAVTPPTLERLTAPREVAPDRTVERAAAPERQRLATTADPVGATADRLAAAPGQDANAPTLKPAAPARSAEPASVAVARRRPREVAMAAPALPVTPPLSPRLPAAARNDSEPPQQPTLALATRRGIVTPTDAPSAAVEPITSPASAAGTEAATALAPRPQASTAGLTAPQARADRGTWAPLRSSTTARETPADGVTDVTTPSQATTATAGRTAASVGEAGITGVAMTPTPLAAAPLARSSLTGGISSAAGSSTGPETTVAAIALPATAAAAAGGPSGDMPSPRALSRLGDRAAAATQSLAAAAAAEANAGGDALDAEELSSAAEAGAVMGSLTTRSRGDDPAAAIVPLPLDRVAAVTLPIEGRVREIAIPFARRSRANRDARGSDQPSSEPAIREKTRMAADAMVDRGLDFLARAQQPDGRWRLGTFPGSTAADTPKLSCDTAATGLAILSFLGAGHDHFGGKHRDTVRRGLEFLLSVQKDDGDLYLPTDKLSDSCAWLYSHGIASMALCEAVGMTGDPLVKPAASRACDFIATSQHPSRGGWRYTPRSDADLSVSGWMLVALRSGRLAGIEVEPRAFDGVKTLLDASAIAADPARYHYNPRNPQQRPSQLSAGCMTAVGTLMRLHTGWKASDPRVQQSARALAALRPTYSAANTKEKTRDCYLWYYASQVLVHTGGDEWTDWYDQLATTLEQTQERQGPRAGSWDPLGAVPDRWGQYGGRIYVTALHLLALEVPDRRLPTYGSPEDAVER